MDGAPPPRCAGRGGGTGGSGLFGALIVLGKGVEAAALRRLLYLILSPSFFPLCGEFCGKSSTGGAVGQFSIRFWVRNPNRNRFPQTDSDSESVTGVKFVRSALRNGSGRRTRRGGAGVFTDERCRNLASDSMT